MQSCYLDSNVLIYFKDESSLYYNQTKNLIKKLITENFQIFISSLVLDEFLYVLTFFLKKDKGRLRKLKQLVNDILEIPNLEIANPKNSKKSQLRVVDLIESYNLKPRDSYHLLIMLENKISYFATLDNDFNQVFAAKLIEKLI